jgi:rod shape-determining protein MreB
MQKSPSATLEENATEANPEVNHSSTTGRAAPARKTAPVGSPRKTLLVGLDWGTNTSCVLASPQESNDYSVTKVYPTVLGYVRDGLVTGILPRDEDVFFGDEALEHLVHLDLVWPMANGIIDNLSASKDYIRWIRSVVDPHEEYEIRAVIGVPANATEAARESVRKAVTGVFESILLIPEPFLAALGFRDDKRLGEREYVDPVTNSLFIDIGAGTTDLCLVQGYFPGPDDQISFNHAGNNIDAEIRAGLEKRYPDMRLSDVQIRQIKEKHSYVGPSRRPLDEKVIVQGKSHTIEVADVVGNACNRLLDSIYDGVKELIERASPDSVRDLMQNILITGGGSRIKGIDTVLLERLTEDGYESPRVRTVGQEYKRFVGIGASKAARAARDSQWQVLFR